MRGRAKITYRKAEREILQGADKYVEDNVTANIEFQNRIAGTHSTQGNRLNNIYYRMSSGTKRNQQIKEANQLHIQNTFEAYFQDFDVFGPVARERPHAADLRTKILDFRGVDSRRISISRAEFSCP